MWNRVKNVFEMIWSQTEARGILISFGISFVLGIIVTIIVLVKML